MARKKEVEEKSELMERRAAKPKRIKGPYKTPGVLQTAVILKALHDETFKKTLMENPIEAIKSNFHLSDLDFKDIKINVVEETDKEFYLVIPSMKTIYDPTIVKGYWWKPKDINLREYPELVKTEMINKIK